MTPADRQRAYRERNGARVGQSPGPAPSAPCGTVSAYKRHLRHGEQPCQACRAAWSAFHRARYAANASRIAAAVSPPPPAKFPLDRMAHLSHSVRP